MRRGGREWAAALLLALGLGCASPSPELKGLDLEGWIELRSPHFVLLGDASQQRIERYAEDLAVFIAVVELITNASAGGSTVPARIHLLEGRAAELFIPSWLAGYMTPRLDGYFAAVGVSNADAGTREVLLHEYTHFLVRKGRALRYPIWYDEGFAEVVSTVRRRQDLVTLGTPALGRMSPIRGRELDLRAVFAPGRQSDIEDPYLFYSLAWAATHYFFSHPDEGDRMRQFVNLQGGGVGWQEAFARSFDVPIDELSLRVAEHVDGLTRGALTGVVEMDARDLEVERSWTLERLEPAEVADALGAFALVIDHPSLADALFSRAVALDPAQARSRLGLALARALQGDFGDALAQVEQAPASAREDPRAQILAGDTQRLRSVNAAAEGDAESARLARIEARRAYATARDLSPRDPAAWAGLGWSYLGSRDPRVGIEAMERARTLGAWDPSVALDLGRLYRQAGDLRRARALWMEAARLGGEEAAAEADRLLEEVGVAEPPAAADLHGRTPQTPERWIAADPLDPA